MFKLDPSLCPDADRKYECEAFTLPSLIAWLETKDPEQEYNWNCTDGSCLLGQYANAVGHDGSNYDMLINKFRAAMGPSGIDIEPYQYFPASSFIARESPWTFGAALDRARAYALSRALKYVAGTP